ncbi:MAG: electron transfer flavoprotein subunit alpha/FixB family protein [Acidimicrobiales bacterium]
MTRTAQIWAVIEGATDPASLLGAAGQAATDVVALVVGARAVAEHVSTFGPSETRWLGEPLPTVSIEDYAAAIARLAEQEAPAAVIMISSDRTRLLAGRLAAHLDTAALTDVTELWTDGDAIVVTRPLYGGAAVRTEQLLSPIGVITVSAGALPALDAHPSAPGQVIDAPCDVQESVTTLLGRRPEPHSAGELSSARVVVGAGRGVSRQENLTVVQDLARALGGELACTRPLAEGLNWMGRDRYLGVSGLEISPDLYVAVGISGQIQHMVGVDGARVIVAINNDKTAPVFSQADYGIVGDLNEVVPALIGALGVEQ